MNISKFLYRLDKIFYNRLDLFSIACFFSIILLVASLYISWTFTTDDAYITLRYANNFYKHGILSWNIDDITPVEGYSNSLYLFIAIIANTISIDAVLLLKSISTVSLICTFIIVFQFVSKIANKWFGLMSCLFYGTYIGTLWWNVSGLETSFYVFITTLCIFTYTSKHNNRTLLACSILIFIASITRPEGPIIGITISIHLIISSITNRRSIKELLIDILLLAAPFIILYSSYFLIRYNYFGEIWPNTYYCKTSNVDKPWKLIINFITTSFPYLAIGLYSFKKGCKQPAIYILYLYIFLTQGLLYNVDPIIGHYNRHSLTSVLFGYIVAVIALFELQILRKKTSLLALSFTSLIVVSFVFKTLPTINQKAIEYSQRTDSRFRLASFINSNNINNYAIGDAGLVPFLTPKAKVYDYYCLNSKKYTSDKINNNINKYLDWLEQQKPDAIVITSKSYETLIPKEKTNELLFDKFYNNSNYRLSPITFGSPIDSFTYHVLLRDESR